VSARAAAVLLVLLAGLLSLHARDPWRYLHDDNGRRYSSYARTHLVLGLERTGGLDYFYAPATGKMVPYGHHPPGLGLLLAGWFRLTGHDGPGAARALAATFHLVSAVLVLGLLASEYAGPPALLAGFAFAVVPMSSYFGKMVNFEPFLLPFMVGVVVAYWRWAEGGNPRWLALAACFAVLGAQIDWPILLVVLVMAADAVRRWRAGGGRRFGVAAVGAVVLCLALAIAIGAWTSRAAGVWELAGAMKYRSRLHGRVTWWRHVGKILDYNRRYFTEPVLVAALLAAVLAARDRWYGRALAPRTRLLLLFGAAGVLPVVAFPSSAEHHPYWQFCLLPYATLSVAEVLDRLGSQLRSDRRRLLYGAAAVWIAVSSASMLATRYSRPSGYVARKVREFAPYL
jgi:4-amino-4-deoxy-L-arabinose transferase-like glycosyltransferase